MRVTGFLKALLLFGLLSVAAPPLVLAQTASGGEVSATTMVQAETQPQAPASQPMFWSWWLGAIALGTLTSGFWMVTRVQLGVSGAWANVVRWKTWRTVCDDTPSFCWPTLSRNQRVPSSAYLLFILMIGVGGFLSSALSGDWHLRGYLDETHIGFFGNAWYTWVIMFAGGVLVGLGTRLGGGCSAGHGLSGIATLQIGSLVGTATFFGTAILVSFLLEALL